MSAPVAVLLGHVDDVLEAHPPEHFRHDAHAASVKRGVDELEVAVGRDRLGAEPEGKQVVEIELVHLGAHGLDAAALEFGGELHLGRIGDLGHLVHDLLVHGSGHLAAVAPADLVAVVFLGIVGGRDHDAGHRLFQAHGIAHHRRGPDIVENEHVDAVRGEHVGGDLGEFLAVVAGIIGDADLRIGVVHVAQDIVRKALGGHSDGVLVHPVGSDAHNAAETAGTEFKVLVERILECGGVQGAHPLDLHLGLLVEITFQPAHRFQFVFFHVDYYVV